MEEKEMNKEAIVVIKGRVPGVFDMLVGEEVLRKRSWKYFNSIMNSNCRMNSNCSWFKCGM